MKLIIGLLVLVGIGWAVMYYAGGYNTFDASDQGIKAKAAITPGMTWKKAFDVTDDPKKWQVIQREVSTLGGQQIETFKPGPQAPFTRENLEKRLQENSIPHGFQCTFAYSDSVAFTIVFDGFGDVDHVEDAVTMTDMLQMKDK